MFADLLQNGEFSSLPTKLFLSLALFAILGSLKERDTENLLSWLYVSVFFLIIRDTVQTFLPLPILVPVLDTLVPIFLVGAIYVKKNNTVFYVYAALSAVLGIGAGIVNLFDLFSSPAWLRADLLSASVALILIGRRVKSDNVRTILSNHGKLFLAVALLLPALSALLPLPFPGIQHILVIPLSYIFFILSALDYGRNGVRELIRDRDGLSDNLDILYGFVLHASDSLKAGGDLNKLMHYVAQTMAEGTNADGSLILMVEDYEDSVSSYALHGDFPPIIEVPEDIERSAEGIRDWLSHLKIPLGEGLIGETAQNGRAVFIKDAEHDERLHVHPSFPPGSLLIVPFLIEDRVIGLALLERKRGRDPFTDLDFDRASLLSGFASLVINNIFSFQDVTERSDIDITAGIAGDIQKALRPKRLPRVPKLSLGVFSESARGVCSDYYDIIPARKDRVYLILGDIAGKGIQAGLIMGMIRAILHLITNSDKNAATILNWINKGITGKIDIDHFATLQILILNPQTGECEYANAGHNPLLIWRSSMGLVDAIESKSVPIGVERKTEFTSTKLVLAPDDVLVSYTDGVVEALSETGKQYGIKSLTTILHKYHEADSADIASKIHDDLKNFIGNARQFDDQSVLVIRTMQ